MLDSIKLKHVWVLTAVGLAVIALAEPLALPPLLLDMVRLWMGALAGFGIDNVHFYFAKPSQNDATPHNMYRRLGFMAAGMLAVSV